MDNGGGERSAGGDGGGDGGGTGVEGSEREMDRQREGEGYTEVLLHIHFSHSTTICNALHSALPHHLRTHTLSRTPFPSSLCDPSLPSHYLLPHDKCFKKLSASASFKKRIASFSSLFLSLHYIRLLSNSSQVLRFLRCRPLRVCPQESGVFNVTVVDLVDFLPFIRRCDLHDLLFFDGAFNFVFSTGFDSVALFPKSFA